MCNFPLPSCNLLLATCNVQLPSPLFSLAAQPAPPHNGLTPRGRRGVVGGGRTERRPGRGQDHAVDPRPRAVSRALRAPSGRRGQHVAPPARGAARAGPARRPSGDGPGGRRGPTGAAGALAAAPPARGRRRREPSRCGRGWRARAGARRRRGGRGPRAACPGGARGGGCRGRRARKRGGFGPAWDRLSCGAAGGSCGAAGGSCGAAGGSCGAAGGSCGAARGASAPRACPGGGRGAGLRRARAGAASAVGPACARGTTALDAHAARGWVLAPPPPLSYQVDTPRPSPRTNRTRRVPFAGRCSRGSPQPAAPAPAW